MSTIVCINCGGDGCKQCNNSDKVHSSKNIDRINTAIKYEQEGNAITSIGQYDYGRHLIKAAEEYSYAGESEDALRSLTQYYKNWFEGDGDGFQKGHILWILRVEGENALEEFFYNILPEYFKNKSAWICREHFESNDDKIIWIAHIKALLRYLKEYPSKINLMETEYYYNEEIIQRFDYDPEISKELMVKAGMEKQLR